MREKFLAISAIIIFFGVGLYCVIGANRMQGRAIEASATTRLPLFRGFIKSRSYVVVARLAGILCIAISALLLFMLIRG
jgi:hypothetical protein